MPSTIKIKFTVKTKWWFTYVYSPIYIALTGFIVDYINIDFEPNIDKYVYWWKKATKLHYVRK